MYITMNVAWKIIYVKPLTVKAFHDFCELVNFASEGSLSQDNPAFPIMGESKNSYFRVRFNQKLKIGFIRHPGLPTVAFLR